jgi:hypothetical protein
MDEVAIFNYALTPSQVLNLYFNAAGGRSASGRADRFAFQHRFRRHDGDAQRLVSSAWAFSIPMAEQRDQSRRHQRHLC